MGRWRYVNFAILIAMGVLLYMALYTAHSPLAPKPLGAVVYPAKAGVWQAQAGHPADLAGRERWPVRVRVCAACYRNLRTAGVAVSPERPAGLDAASVARIRGRPHRGAARVNPAQAPCEAEDMRLWLGLHAANGDVRWLSWPLKDGACAGAS